MTIGPPSIIVEQHTREDYGDLSKKRLVFIVTRTYNTTRPHIGDELNEAEVKELIDPCGMSVTVTQPP